MVWSAVPTYTSSISHHVFIVTCTETRVVNETEFKLTDPKKSAYYRALEEYNKGRDQQFTELSLQFDVVISRHSCIGTSVLHVHKDVLFWRLHDNNVLCT